MAKADAKSTTFAPRPHGTDRRPPFLDWVMGMYADGFIFERRAHNGEPNDFDIRKAGTGSDDTAELIALIPTLPA